VIVGEFEHEIWTVFFLLLGTVVGFCLNADVHDWMNEGAES
jgi:hypothetical protein